MVYLYVEVDRLMYNIRHRGRSYEQDIQREYLERIQAGYLDFIRQQTSMRILVIDTNKIDFVAKPADYKTLLAIITQPYPVGVHQITP
jgi:deoxyadenosine/deoxycytidine kinase